MSSMEVADLVKRLAFNSFGVLGATRRNGEDSENDTFQFFWSFSVPVDIYVYDNVLKKLSILLEF